MSLYKIIKKILQIVPLLWLLVLFDPSEYAEFWEYAWNFLVFLMFIRPIKDIFPKFKILSKAVTFRKELWIISGVFAITHVVWYFLHNSLPATFLFDSIMWDPRGYLGWWMFALIISIILTWTSNIFSIKKFGKYWKIIQKLAYFMLLTAAVHIALVKSEDMFSIIFTILAYIIVYILAYRNNKTNENIILTYFLSLMDKMKVLIKKI